MRFFFGFVLGALAMALFAYRKTISDLYHNRRTISAGAKTVEGAQQVVEGVKGLFNSFDEGGTT